MPRFVPLLASLVLMCTLGAAPPVAPDKGIGDVHRDISCGADANARFDRGPALLHNFWLLFKSSHKSHELTYRAIVLVL